MRQLERQVEQRMRRSPNSVIDRALKRYVPVDFLLRLSFFAFFSFDGSVDRRAGSIPFRRRNVGEARVPRLPRLSNPLGGERGDGSPSYSMQRFLETP